MLRFSAHHRDKTWYFCAFAAHSSFSFLFFFFSPMRSRKSLKEREEGVLQQCVQQQGGLSFCFFFKVTPSQNARSSTRRTPAVPSAHNGARDSVMHGSSKMKVKSRGLSGCNKASLLLETLVHLRAFDVLSLSLLNLKKKRKE